MGNERLLVSNCSANPTIVPKGESPLAQYYRDITQFGRVRALGHEATGSSPVISTMCLCIRHIK